MWNEPTLEDLAKLPRLYSTEHTPASEMLIHEHFFLGGCDWYAAEYSPEERIFFGFAILNDDLQNAEWGYVSFDEMRSINVRGIEVDHDLHWQRRKASQVERICDAGGI